MHLRKIQLIRQKSKPHTTTLNKQKKAIKVKLVLKAKIGPVFKELAADFSLSNPIVQCGSKVFFLDSTFFLADKCPMSMVIFIVGIKSF